LIVDAGSLAWSRYSLSDWTTGPAPDVVDLPRVPGVFDILAGKSDFDDWLLVDDESPTLSALAPGEIPADWEAALQSDAMRELVARARKEADLIIIYAPNIQNHPETIQALGALSNGILLVSGSGVGNAADEVAAMKLLPEGAVVLGRIALGDDPDESEPVEIADTQEPEPVTTEEIEGVATVEARSASEPDLPETTEVSLNGTTRQTSMFTEIDPAAQPKTRTRRNVARRAKQESSRPARPTTPAAKAKSKRLRRNSRTAT
jgi:hypothetical protein